MMEEEFQRQMRIATEFRERALRQIAPERRARAEAEAFERLSKVERRR
jgi:hypothetical protein